MVRLEASPTEAYLAARIDPSIPFSIGIVELTRRMVPFALLGAIACAAFLAFMVGRVFLPQLSALAAIARDPGIRVDGLVSDDTPNEIFEVAQTFRRTLRQLKEEREVMAQQKRELEQMQANLVRASKLASVGRLAAGIAHEIGNPLTAVQGYLSLFPRLDAAEQKEVVERSAKELLRIHETIKKLLTYARQDGEHTPIHPIALRNVVSDSILLLRGHPAFRPVQIKEELLEPNGAEALGDAGRLGQVLVNLLLNAAQAMEGRPDPRIRILERIEGTWVELDVEDNGPGVPQEKREQIFDPFYTTKAPGEGTGLGLAVSRSLVESMDGDLTVSAAKDGAGACFTIRLKRV
jgi:C4-dicarboxylate-specific signal transduction histidine kinase